jgi:6-pyruvoyltetrahydropterin/6-carboxytetrahydropterin synthase
VVRERFGVRVYKEAFNFAAAHFLIFADGTREELHGHNYQVRFAAEGGLDAGDLVLDFLKIKPIVKKVCDAFDHRVILPLRNERLAVAREEGSVVAVYEGRDRFSFPVGDVVLLDLHNTSTERLAEHIAGRVLERVAVEVPRARLARVEVEVEESAGQCGVYQRELS